MRTPQPCNKDHFPPRVQRPPSPFNTGQPCGRSRVRGRGSVPRPALAGCMASGKDSSSPSPRSLICEKGKLVPTPGACGTPSSVPGTRMLPHWGHCSPRGWVSSAQEMAHTTSLVSHRQQGRCPHRAEPRLRLKRWAHSGPHPHPPRVGLSSSRPGRTGRQARLKCWCCHRSDG